MPATVSMSPAQFALFKKRDANIPSTARAPRPSKRKADLPENILESQIKGFLLIRGWTLTRQHVGLFVPFRVLSEKRAKVIPIRIGEKGMSDWRAERPIRLSAHCEMFFFETKAPSQKPRPDQSKWLSEKRALGWSAQWFDCLRDFELWYSARFS